jgi:DnaA family protein
MPLTPAAGRYILNHCARDLHTLEALLDRLDRISLAEKKRPTIAVIQQALQESPEDD